MSPITAAVITFAGASFLQPLVINQLTRKSLLDAPSDRSSHTVPTPRGGGIAVMVGIVIGVLVASEKVAISLLAGVVFAAGVGMLEDLRGVRIGPRLLLTTIAAIALLAALALQGLQPGFGGVVVVVIAVPWTLSVVNAVNFMDGINGISAATAVVGGSAYSLFGWVADTPALTIWGLVVAAGGLAFAPFNVPRARVFLGDVGSYGLGAAFAAMSLLAVSQGLTFEAAIAPVALYLADTSTTIVRRIQAGERWYLPHKRHTYQRLVALGLSHVRVSAAVAMLTAVCAALGAVSLSGSALARAAADVGVLFVLGGYLFSPRSIEGRRRLAG